MKRVIIFDLDETVVDSKHRQPNNPDGTLNLAQYLELKNYENTFKDTLLPLANFWKNLDLTENYVVVCTARIWEQHDKEYLAAHGLVYHNVVARFTEKHNHMKDPVLKRQGLSHLFNLKQFKQLPKFMFDDASPVITEMRKMGITCLNSIAVNKRLAV